MQSLLLDYLGLAKTGRETRTLVEIFPEFFLVAGENAQGEGAIVTLRDDAPDVGDDEEGDMARVRRAVDEYEREDIERRRPADDEDDLGPLGPGNEDVVPEVVSAAAGAASANDPVAEARRRLRREQDRERRAADTIFQSFVDRAGRRADGAPSRRGRRPR